jgi:hypothetical protein
MELERLSFVFSITLSFFYLIRKHTNLKRSSYALGFFWFSDSLVTSGLLFCSIICLSRHLRRLFNSIFFLLLMSIIQFRNFKHIRSTNRKKVKAPRDCVRQRSLTIAIRCQ